LQTPGFNLLNSVYRRQLRPVTDGCALAWLEDITPNLTIPYQTNDLEFY